MEDINRKTYYFPRMCQETKIYKVKSFYFQAEHIFCFNEHVVNASMKAGIKNR